MVGKENKGYEVIVYQLDRERISLAPVSPLEHRIEETIKWAKNTEVNGKPVIDHEGVRTKLAELLAEVEVLKLLKYKIVDCMTKGLPVWAEASTLKVVSAELNVRVNNALLSIMGLYGQVHNTDQQAPAGGKPELHFREDVLQGFVGGAIEVQRDIIAMVGLGMPKTR
jgi:alkylation response protein AidB-like acyl-CoA dehydrogenase